MKITAISGWAIPAGWFQDEIQNYFPDAEIRVLTPAFPNAADEAESLLQAHPADLYIGYSMGSLWLLKNREFLSTRARKILLAPILAFTRESSMGGKTSESQLKYLLKVINRNPGNRQPLLNFYNHCELPFPESFLKDVPDRGTLVRGLEFLSSYKVESDAADDFLSLSGDEDVFIDGEALKLRIPHLHIIKGAGHSPGKLLEQAALLLDLREVS